MWNNIDFQLPCIDTKKKSTNFQCFSISSPPDNDIKTRKKNSIRNSAVKLTKESLTPCLGIKSHLSDLLGVGSLHYRFLLYITHTPPLFFFSNPKTTKSHKPCKIFHSLSLFSLVWISLHVFRIFFPSPATFFIFECSSGQGEFEREGEMDE